MILYPLDPTVSITERSSSADGDVNRVILSDDQFINHAFFDDRHYLHLCQSQHGRRLFEIELAPEEVDKLKRHLFREFVDVTSCACDGKSKCSRHKTEPYNLYDVLELEPTANVEELTVGEAAQRNKELTLAFSPCRWVPSRFMDA